MKKNIYNNKNNNDIFDDQQRQSKPNKIEVELQNFIVFFFYGIVVVLTVSFSPSFFLLLSSLYFSGF
jgi:hypothetical protein